MVADDLSVRAVEEAVREHQGEHEAGAPDDASTASNGVTGPPHSSARPVCSSSRSCSATTSRPGSRSRWAAARGKVVVEFSTLEDLERIYRLMTDGGGPDHGREHRRRTELISCARK